MRIDWKEIGSPPVDRGHGVEFRSAEGTDDTYLFAFLDGYGWLKDNPEEVQIVIKRPDVRHTVEFLKTARAVIEQSICTEKLRHGPLGDNVFAWFNA